MGIGPEPYSHIGRKAKDLLNKDYNFDHKFNLLIPHTNGMSLAVTCFKKDQIFVGDISTLYKSGNTTVDVKIDTYSNVSAKLSVDNICPGTKTAFSFKIPDHKSGKLDLEYRNHHAAINSSIGLNPTPLLEIQTAIGTKDVSLGGEIGFDTVSASFNKYNAGVSFNSPDFAAALILADKGRTLKASYVHTLNQRTSVAVEMTREFSTEENTFTIGSSHWFDPYNSVKTRFTDKGKVSLQWQKEWRPKSHAIFSAEYESKLKFGIAILLKP